MSESEDRRIIDEAFKKDISDRILSLENGHIEIKNALQRNNELTENINAIIEGAKGFFNFCIKMGRAIKWTAKTGTPIVIFVTAAYHAIDAIASHDVGALIKAWRHK